MPPGRAIVALLELFEHPADRILRDTRTRVADAESEYCPRALRPLAGGTGEAHHVTAALRELDGVADEIHQDLAKAHLVADDAARQSGIDPPADRKPLVPGSWREQLDHALHGIGDLERGIAELDLARFDLREVEHLLD